MLIIMQIWYILSTPTILILHCSGLHASLKTDDFDPKGNDTLIYYQVFKNYFAFDDGSSEGGYGINGLGSRNAMVAYRFTSYHSGYLEGYTVSVSTTAIWMPIKEHLI